MIMETHEHVVRKTAVTERQEDKHGRGGDSWERPND